jgi:bacteriorhodopsin
MDVVSGVDSGTRTVLWVVSAIMILGCLAFIVMSVRSRDDNRHFFYASAFIPLVAATLCFAMASGYGTIVQGGHTFYFARYIDWLMTTPLLLLDLALVALPRYPGRSALIGILIGSDAYMIVTGFVAPYIRSDYRSGHSMGSVVLLSSVFCILLELAS